MSDTKRPGISGSLKRSAAQKGGSSGDRFDAADKTMSRGGYAKKPLKTAGGRAPQATSFRATEVDQKLLVALRAELMTHAGASVSNTDALRAGLRALEALTPDDRLEHLYRAWEE